MCFFAGMGVKEGAPIRWLAPSPERSLPPTVSAALLGVSPKL